MADNAHWESIYRGKAPTAVSWYSDHLLPSLDLIRQAKIPQGGSVVDVGGGASTLVDDLLEQGIQDVTVCDLSGTALRQSRQRLGERSKRVTWIEDDILHASFESRRFDLWHDRAVFHFLTSADDRRQYIARLRHALKPSGHFVVSTFSLTGPPKCSGLEVVRYSPESLHAELGDAFALVRNKAITHVTPSGTRQDFICCDFALT